MEYATLKCDCRRSAYASKYACLTQELFWAYYFDKQQTQEKLWKDSKRYPLGREISICKGVQEGADE